jgi:DNA-binding winged helix-turn-helix (wHTH) protein/serine/threonine protein kinase
MASMAAIPAHEPTIPAAPRAGRIWRFSTVVFNEAAVTLTVDGSPVAIERRPVELLMLLLRHAGEVVTKDEIFEALWPGRVVGDASLTKCVARLRLALADGEQELIRTVHGYGYRLVAKVAVEAMRPDAETLPASLDFKPGDTVRHRPNWRLVERLGTGGFGDAWLGEHGKTGERRVFKFGRHGAHLAALRREITLSRLLRAGLGLRDDLAPVLDWNLEEPPYFIEIGWSSQGNLAVWADKQGGIGQVPLDRRLDLVAAVAEALAAAHSMGVLHKDLKPENILVHLDPTGRPRIRLTDFGSGRLLDQGRLDEFGITRLATESGVGDTSSGTLLYCAPELIAGQVPTVQADIYALGIILYQMAIGDLKRVLAPGWEHGVADPLLCSDIAAAAAGDPARRLADAAELARRLRTLDTRRAEHAREEAALAAAERTRQALDRAQARRAPFMALIAVLLVGFGISTWFYLLADAAGRQARRDAARAQTVTKFLTDDLLSAANPFLSADPNISVKQLLDVAAKDIDRRFQSDSLDRAAIEEAIGNAYAGLSDSTRAMPLLTAALEARRQALGDGDPQTQAVRLAMAALAERKQDSDGMRSAGLAVLAAHPRDAETELGARFYVLSGGCGLGGNSADCVTQLQPFLEEVRRRLGPRAPFTLKVESELASRLGDAQRPAEAIPMAREAVALTEQVFGPDHPLVQERRFYLASVLVQADQAEEAIDILTDVRRRLLAMSGTETTISARVVNQLGMAFGHAKRYPESLAALQIALDYSVKTRGESDEVSLAVMNNIAGDMAQMGRTKDAIALARRVLDAQRGRTGPDDVDALWDQNNLADDYLRDGNLAEAEAQFRDVLDRARRVFAHREWDLGQFAFRLGGVLAEEGKTDEARSLLEESVTILTAALGPEDVHSKRAAAALAALAPAPAKIGAVRPP